VPSIAPPVLPTADQTVAQPQATPPDTAELIVPTQAANTIATTPVSAESPLVPAAALVVIAAVLVFAGIRLMKWLRSRGVI
jgi:hypothetical protein